MHALKSNEFAVTGEWRHLPPLLLCLCLEILPCGRVWWYLRRAVVVCGELETCGYILHDLVCGDTGSLVIFAETICHQMADI